VQGDEQREAEGTGKPHDPRAIDTEVGMDEARLQPQ
jgi:hypothetical protein